jgi:hypothetical protein
MWGPGATILQVLSYWNLFPLSTGNFSQRRQVAGGGLASGPAKTYSQHCLYLSIEIIWLSFLLAANPSADIPA